MPDKVGHVTDIVTGRYGGQLTSLKLNCPCGCVAPGAGELGGGSTNAVRLSSKLHMGPPPVNDALAGPVPVAVVPEKVVDAVPTTWFSTALVLVALAALPTYCAVNGWVPVARLLTVYVAW